MTTGRVESPPIVLTTDFGLSDAFVGVMKGVILRISPAAVIVDLTHDIGPQNLRQGSFVLGANFSYFPMGAVHVAVVDPGVGTDRRAVAVETPDATFVAPDNGLLSEVINRYLAGPSPAGRRRQDSVLGVAGRIALPDSLKAYSLEEPRFRLEPLSNTFHGRDLFAPAAAHISLGVSPAEMGPRVFDLVYSPLPSPAVQDEAIVGEIVYVDRYGNLISNITRDHAAGSGVSLDGAEVQFGDRRIDCLSRTFNDAVNIPSPQPDGLPLVALFGSSGNLEIAVQNGSAAQSLAAGAGAPVTISSNPL